VEEPSVSDWRRETFGDLTSAFRFSHGRPRPPRLPEDTAEQLRKAQQEVATLPKPTLPKPTPPGADQRFPRQERGRRPPRVTERSGGAAPGPRDGTAAR
jgi:phospholipase C